MAARVEIPLVVLNELSPYNPVSGAECTIKKRGTEELATIYKDSGTTNETYTNPITTDSAGRLTGWLERGAYECTVQIPGKTAYIEPFDAAPAKDEGIDSKWLAKEAVTGEKVASSIKDAAVGTPSLRTLGSGATQAAPGNDSRLSDERVPTNNSVSSAKIQAEAVEDGKMKSPNNSVYRTIATGSTPLSLDVGTGNYIFSTEGGTGIYVAGTEKEVSSFDGLHIFRLIAADYAVTGKTTKLRMKGVLLTNGTAPGCNISVALFPISSVEGGADKMKITVGGQVGNSPIWEGVGAKEIVHKEGSDFTIPAEGNYALGFIIGGSALANNAIAHLSADLQVRNV